MSELERTKMEMDILKIVSDMKKNDFDTMKVIQEYKWYPFVIGGGLVLTGVTFAQLFLK